jgi:hypothetical protein
MIHRHQGVVRRAGQPRRRRVSRLAAAQPRRKTRCGRPGGRRLPFGRVPPNGLVHGVGDKGDVGVTAHAPLPTITWLE